LAKSTATSHISADALKRFDELIATQPGVERKGATMPYTSVNGHMFSFLSDSGTLALRLPAAERQTFLQRFETTLHKSHDTVMKEYVTVPETVFADPDQLRPYFAKSYAYVVALTPKPTRRAS
jgi:TfoX/Sxy family transcriptional regulator of competence genes